MRNIKVNEDHLMFSKFHCWNIHTYKQNFLILSQSHNWYVSLLKTAIKHFEIQFDVHRSRVTKINLHQNLKILCSKLYIAEQQTENGDDTDINNDDDDNTGNRHIMMSFHHASLHVKFPRPHFS